MTKVKYPKTTHLIMNDSVILFIFYLFSVRPFLVFSARTAVERTDINLK